MTEIILLLTGAFVFVAGGVVGMSYAAWRLAKVLGVMERSGEIEKASIDRIIERMGLGVADQER